MAPGLDLSQRMLEAGEAESRFVSQLVSGVLSSCLSLRRSKDLLSFSGSGGGVMKTASCWRAVV